MSNTNCVHLSPELDLHIRESGNLTDLRFVNNHFGGSESVILYHAELVALRDHLTDYIRDLDL